jgi:hypothetical protein
MNLEEVAQCYLRLLLPICTARGAVWNRPS